MANSHDQLLIEGIREGNEKIFDYVFRYYYPGLVVFVFKYINDKTVSEDIVQEFFLKLWLNRKKLNIKTSIKAYFFTSIKNGCIDYLRQQVAKEKSLYAVIDNISSLSDERNLLIESELRDQINNAINKLPPACKETFILNRFEGLKPAQIAVQMEVSVRTVEAHIGKALKILRVELATYLPIQLLLSFFVF